MLTINELEGNTESEYHEVVCNYITGCLDVSEWSCEFNSQVSEKLKAENIDIEPYTRENFNKDN